MNIALDTQLNDWLISMRNPGMTKIMLGITYLGNEFVATAMVIALVGVLFFLKKKKLIAPFLITVIGSTFSLTLLKLLVHRARPLHAVYLEPTFSFPSGHATIAVALFGFIAYLLYQTTKTTSVKKAWLILCGFLVLLIGFSRLYLGVHYLTDVLAGFILGGAWLWLGIVRARQTK